MGARIGTRRAYIPVISRSGGGAAPTYTISGVVYDADGTTPVEGATVALGLLTANSAADGTYTISGVAVGASGSMTCTKTGYSWTAITVAAMSDNLTAQNYTNVWYAAGGIAASVLAVWKPIGAASLGASYLRIAGAAGNADLDPAVVGGVAPTWSAEEGWIGNHLSGFPYLKTAINSFIAGTGSVAFRYSDAQASNTAIIFGTVTAGKVCYLQPNKVTNTAMQVGLGDGATPSSFNTAAAAGATIVIAGKKVYKDGTLLGTVTATPATCDDLYILARENGGSPAAYSGAHIQAIAFYSTDISASAEALSTAMAALNP